MYQHLRPLDVSEEVVAEPDPGVRAFDQPRDVDDYDAVIPNLRGA